MYLKIYYNSDAWLKKLITKSDIFNSYNISNLNQTTKTYNKLLKSWNIYIIKM